MTTATTVHTSEEHPRAHWSLHDGPRTQHGFCTLLHIPPAAAVNCVFVPSNLAPSRDTLWPPRVLQAWMELQERKGEGWLSNTRMPCIPSRAGTSWAWRLSRGLFWCCLSGNRHLHVLSLPYLSREENKPWAGEMILSAGLAHPSPSHLGDPERSCKGMVPFHFGC